MAPNACRTTLVTTHSNLNPHPINSGLLPTNNNNTSIHIMNIVKSLVSFGINAAAIATNTTTAVATNVKDNLPSKDKLIEDFEYAKLATSLKARELSETSANLFEQARQEHLSKTHISKAAKQAKAEERQAKKELKLLKKTVRYNTAKNRAKLRIEQLRSKNPSL